MELLDFPNELLEAIAQHLDPVSLGSFALTNHRMRQIAVNVKKSIKLDWVDPSFMDQLPCRINNLEHLNLSGCYADTDCLRELIMRCKNLKKLNVVNTELSFEHVLDVLRELKHLKEISFSVVSPHLPNTMDSEIFKTDTNVREIYIEATPRIGTSNLIPDFLNECKSVELVHLNLIGREMLWSPPRTSRNKLKTELWDTLQTVILSCHLSDFEIRADLMMSIFSLCGRASDVHFWARDNMQFFTYVPGHVARNSTTEVVATRDIAYMKDMNYLSFSPHFAVINAFRFFSGEHSVIVEVDLTDCHSPFLTKCWNNLVEKLPSLKALAVPICFWPQGGKFDWRRERPAQRKSENRRENFAIEALRKIRLEKLHVNGSLLSDTACAKCQNAATRYKLGNLGLLTSLEEFTLRRVPAHPRIFEDLMGSHLKTLRLCFDGISYIAGLEEYLRNCKTLRYLKLEGSHLPLHCSSLWEALVAGSELRQVCLSSELCADIDIRKISKMFLELMNNLDVLHVHVPNVRNHNQFREGLLDVARKVQGSKMSDVHDMFARLHYCQIDRDPWTHIDEVCVEGALPGRTLCVSANLVAKLKTVGWTLP